MITLISALYARTFSAREDQVSEVRAEIAGLLAGYSAADDLVLIASELAANAVVHSASGHGGSFRIEVEVHHGYIWVEVQDQGGPWKQDSGNDGRPHGLDIVSLLCGKDNWGVEGDQACRAVGMHRPAGRYNSRACGQAGAPGPLAGKTARPSVLKAAGSAAAPAASPDMTRFTSRHSLPLAVPVPETGPARLPQSPRKEFMTTALSDKDRQLPDGELRIASKGGSADPGNRPPPIVEPPGAPDLICG